MISKVRYSIVACVLFIWVTSPLCATDWCWWSNDASLKKEAAVLKQEIENLKNQMLLLRNEYQKGFEDQKNQINDSVKLDKVLVKYGNNPDGMSALHYAIKAGDVYAVNLLLENGADANSVEMSFRPQISITALSRAAKCNQLEITAILLDFGADVNFSPYEDSFYPITYAAEFASGDLVTLLIENGAKLDRIKPVKEGQDGKPESWRRPETPLHIACIAGNFEAVIALVYAGIDIDGFVPNPVSYGYSGCNETPLGFAAKNLKYSDNPKNLDLIKFLVAHDATRRCKEYCTVEFNKIPCEVISGYLKSVNK